jgi:hypothetical protein
LPAPQHPASGAAEAALARIKARFGSWGAAEPIELQFGIADPWCRQLFLALARRYGLSTG